MSGENTKPLVIWHPSQ